MSSRQGSMNAVTLRLLIHYYYSPKNYEGEMKDSPAIKNGHEYLEKQGLIGMANSDDDVEGKYVITEAGRMHVEKLINHPLPVKKWVYEEDRA